jgi:GNAT superfamily N-acetyltransferase
VVARLRHDIDMIEVRAAVEDDLDAVVMVGHRTWPAAYTELAGADYVERGLATWWTPESTLAGIQAGRVSVAERDGRIIGMAGTGPGEGCLILWKLYVLPEEQGHGAGTALLERVISEAEAAGEHVVRLEYLAGNTSAEAFYRARGFRETGREPDADGGPDQVWMELSLTAGPAT